MQHPGSAGSPRLRFGLWAGLYILAMAYVSTVLGPLGLHFVPLDPALAWHRYLAVRFFDTGSDQRADWMGNLTMLVPLGFLVSGAIWPRSGVAPRMLAAATAFALCTAVILAIKFAQLFFPPRTVSLNYIAAQCLGAALGIILLAAFHHRAASLLRGAVPRGRQGLLLILRLYTGLLVLFLLVPFDITLSAADLADRLAELPGQLFALTAAGRPLTERLAVLIAGTLATVPIGALLVLAKPRRAIARSVPIGFCLMLGVTLASMLLISGTTSLPALAYRTIGILLGASLIRWLLRQDLVRVRAWLREATPLLVLPYLAALVLVNGLLARHWVSLADAVASLHERGLIPLYDYYIVSKTQAAKNVVAHILMYAPIGVLLWMRSLQRPSAALAFWLASLLAGGIEFARWLQPGRQPDINAVGVAAVVAFLAARWMPAVWRLITEMILGSRLVQDRNWLRPVPAAARGDVAAPRPDVEYL